MQSDGCRGQSLCVEKKLDVNGIVCPEICPKACSDRELRVHGGSDPRGCLVEDTCVANDCYDFDTDYLVDSVNNCVSAENAQYCQEKCEDEEKCTAFTFIGNANKDDENCCLIESRPAGNKRTVASFVSGPKRCEAAKEEVAKTVAPTEAAPTAAPTQAPTEAPTQAPTQAPTEAPTEAPTQAPTQAPTEAPTQAPTQAPTEAPTQAPTEAPTQAPTEAPTQAPTEAPTQAPTEAPAAD